MTKTNPREGRNWPAYILGGRMRTSTLALIIAFVGVGWLYEIYEPGPQAPEQIPASEVVPPGFIPDPNYTWAPRTDVRGPELRDHHHDDADHHLDDADHPDDAHQSDREQRSADPGGADAAVLAGAVDRGLAATRPRAVVT